MKESIKLYRSEILGSMLCLSLGIFSGLLVNPSESVWFANLVRPSFNPPNWIFGPVWTVLYIMMGMALGRIWNNRKTNFKVLLLFFIQFIFNLAWSPLFFYYERIDLALVDICLLWISIFALVFSVRKNKVVLFLLLPYLAWVSFALVLNFKLYQLN